MVRVCFIAKFFENPPEHLKIVPCLKECGAGAGLFWSEPEPKKLAGSGSEQSVDILTIFWKMQKKLKKRTLTLI